MSSSRMTSKLGLQLRMPWQLLTTFSQILWAHQRMFLELDTCPSIVDNARNCQHLHGLRQRRNPHHCCCHLLHHHLSHRQSHRKNSICGSRVQLCVVLALVKMLYHHQVLARERKHQCHCFPGVQFHVVVAHALLSQPPSFSLPTFLCLYPNPVRRWGSTYPCQLCDIACTLHEVHHVHRDGG